MSHPIVSTPKQADLQAIPETPFVYWLRPRFFELLRSGRTVSSQYPVKWGVSSSDNDRFLRLFWEVVPAPHWLNHAKGGGFSRWRGLERWVLDWSNDGQLVKEWILERYPYLGDNYEIKIRDHTFFKWGWSYSSMARHGLGFRLLDPSWTTNAKAPAILSETRDVPLGALLNGRVSTYLVRALMTSVNVDEGYVAGLPLPDSIPEILDKLGEACLLAKSRLVARDLTERGFNPDDYMEGSGETGTSTSLLEVVRRNQVEEEVVAGLLHSLEAYNERLVFDAYELDQDDVRAVLDETGTPSGWYPLIPGYDRLPDPPAGTEVPDGFAAYFASLERRELSAARLAELKARVRRLYEAGPGATASEEEPKDDGETEEDILGAHIPIPAETFLEELSQKLQIHPVSVYNLLEELRAEGAYSPPEVKRLMEDRVSVALLLMLGYRWPEQDRYEAESGPALDEDLIDADGIIPLVPCDGQPTADARLRTLLERRFGEEGAARSLEEFRTWVGSDLGRWLKRAFFARHSKQFKYRPIAWHLTSPEGTFQAFVLYHRLSRDTLRRLRDVYAGALINRLRAELNRAEQRKDAQQAQELRFQIEDVEEFRDRLTAIEEGRELRHRIRCRWKGEDEDGRPGPYAPDIDDGVKVNIRPFQETGLLAREVIKKW